MQGFTLSDSVYGRAIHHCANKLVTDMDVDDVIDKLQSKSIFKEQTIQKIQVWCNERSFRLCFRMVRLKMFREL